MIKQGALAIQEPIKAQNEQNEETPETANLVTPAADASQTFLPALVFFPRQV